jgi:hypothetical protein
MSDDVQMCKYADMHMNGMAINNAHPNSPPCHNTAARYQGLSPIGL